MRIGLFDSGLGGLTVLKTLLKKYPQNEYFYYGDTLNIPYGNKTKEELQVLASKAIDYLLEYNIDLIIIACGTVSSNCLDYLKNKYTIPIYDIISPTIKYLNDTDYQNIGVIATQSTINSHIFKNNINKNVTEIATPELVPLIENNELDKTMPILKNYLANYISKLDVLVLGCTHYPIIANNIRSILPKTKIIDMSEYITLKNDGKKGINLYFTKLDDKIINNIKTTLDNDMVTINIVK